jgi:hypothetical protein
MIQIINALSDPAWADVQAVAIAEDLRQADRQEIAASSGLPPLTCIREGIKLSDSAWIVLDRAGAPVSIFGVAPSTQEGVGVVWLLGTNRMMREALPIARATGRCIRQLHTRYTCLFNFVDARNEVSLRWLHWAGFDIAAERHTHGTEGRLFYEVVRFDDASASGVF